MHCPVRLLVALSFALGAAVSQAQQTTLPPSVSAALARAGLPESSLSAMVVAVPLQDASVPLNQGPTRADAQHHGDLPPARLAYRVDAAMNPASVMKLVTTYASLQTLGGNFRWRTQVLRDGRLLPQGVLDGNLIIQGGGDPYLTYPRVQELLAQVQAAGIRHIRGDLIIDRSMFKLSERDPAAFDGKPSRPYNASPDGLLLNFKVLEFNFKPISGGRAEVAMQPPLAGVQIPSTVATSSGPCGDASVALGADLSDPLNIAFNGSYPVSCGRTSVYYAYYAQPQAYALRALTGMWLAAGGSINGNTREGLTPRSAKRILTYRSPALRDVIVHINKYSNNVMAQQLFLSAPSLSGRKRRPSTWAQSQKWVGSWWQRHMHGSRAPVLENGSGLSRKERISAAALSTLLQHAAHSPEFDDFAQSLAIAGVDGTVAKMRVRDADNSALGQARLKTGTLDTAKAVAGYVIGRSGQLYSVVGMVNHSRAPAAQEALDALLDWTARDQ